MQNFETEENMNNTAVGNEEIVVGEVVKNDNNTENNENFAQAMTDSIYAVHAAVNEAINDVEMANNESKAENSAFEEFAPAADATADNTTHAADTTTTDNTSTAAAAQTSAQATNPQLVKEQIKYCQRILKGLKRHREAGPFLLPVDPVALNIPDYFTVIKQPMDLSTISKKLDLNEYATAEAFMADVRLMLTNCFTYNAPDSQVTKMGRNLEKYFNTAMAKMPTELTGGSINTIVAVGLESPSGGGSRPKRESSVVAVGGGNQILGSQVRRASSPSGSLTFCSAVLRELMKKTNSHLNWPFVMPVDPVALNIPDYFDVIKQPMDLGTIRKKLDTGMYVRSDQFEGDVRLVFSNCYAYNPPESDICKMARELESIFEQKMAQKPAPKAHHSSTNTSASSSTSSVSHHTHPHHHNHQSSAMSQSASSSSVHPLASQMIPNFDTLADDSDKILSINRYIQMLQAELNHLLINRKPSSSTSYYGSASGDVSSSMTGVAKTTSSKPKQQRKPAAPSALASSKPTVVADEMSFEEKRQLSEDVSNLPQENMMRVLEIIQECMPNLHSNGDSDVIELDIEALDVRTLRTLQGYIWECQNPGKKRKVPAKTTTAATAVPSAGKKLKNEENRPENQSQNSYDSSSSSSSEDDD